MKITLLQTDIVWCSPEDNVRIAEEMIGSAPKSDLYVFPEMFTTGFCMSPSEIAEPDGGFGFGWMKRTALATGSAIAGSIAVVDDGKYYNRLYFFYPDGTFIKYDKFHLFSYSGEDKLYTHGIERIIIEYMGIRILPIICYDLRFPVFIRNRGDYDMILCVANWPCVRRDPWRVLTVARAIENQCYVAAVNRAGSDMWGKYSGDTQLIDPCGKGVVECEKYVAGHVTGDIDMVMLENFRKKFPVLYDADDFILKQRDGK
ncbi:MAG: nitrilase-related carbon-nitrogen hydrolase [Bacteroidales bacterium]